MIGSIFVVWERFTTDYFEDLIFFNGRSGKARLRKLIFEPPQRKTKHYTMLELRNR